MATNPRKEPSALTRIKGNKRKLSKDALDARAAHEIYAADGDVVPPAGMEGAALEMFNVEAAYMSRVNEAMMKAEKKRFYGANDAAPLQVMVEAHLRYLHYKELEQRTSDLKKLQLFNQLKNKEAQTEKAYRQALKLDPASRVDFGAGKGGSDEQGEFNV